MMSAQMATAERFAAFEGFGQRFCKTTRAKIPMTPAGTPAKSNDRETWATLDTVLDSLRPAEFVGVFLGGGDDIPAGKSLGCIDLDKCKNERGEWESWVIELVEKSGTYTETSMSGNGVHIFGFVDDSIKSHKKNGVEIYTGARFIAMTGAQSFGTFPINDISGVVNEIIDAEFSRPETDKKPIPATIPAGAGDWERASYLVENLKDKVTEYNDYFAIGGALASAFGERGGELFAKFAENPNYNDSPDKVLSDYRGILNGLNGRSGSNANRYNFGTLVFIGKKYGIEIPINTFEWREQRPATDAENARVLVQLLEGTWLYNFDSGAWYYYNADSGLWERDGAAKIYTTILSEMAKIKFDVVKNPHEHTNNILKKAIALESTARIKAALTLAAALLPANSNSFDISPNLVGVKNGVLDLSDGVKFIEKSPLHMLTRSMGTEYIAGAACPNWLKFLERVQPKKEIREFLQRLDGVTLLGGNPIQKIINHVGIGGNGKSIYVGTKAKIFGDYSVKLPLSTFASGKMLNPDKAQNELARTRGKKFVYLSETEEGVFLNENLIKDFAGSEAVTTRKLYEETTEIDNVGIPTISGNYRMRVKGKDFGIWRRTLLIDWLVIIPENERREPKELLSIHAAESAGILNWIIAGLKDYNSNGLRIPESVTASVQEYRKSEDLITDFISSEIEFFPAGGGVSVTVADAFAQFINFLESIDAEKEFAGTRRKFTEELKRRNYHLIPVYQAGKRTHLWDGARLRDNESDDRETYF